MHIHLGIYKRTISDEFFIFYLYTLLVCKVPATTRISLYTPAALDCRGGDRCFRTSQLSCAFLKLLFCFLAYGLVCLSEIPPNVIFTDSATRPIRFCSFRRMNRYRERFSLPHTQPFAATRQIANRIRTYGITFVRLHSLPFLPDKAAFIRHTACGSNSRFMLSSCRIIVSSFFPSSSYASFYANATFPLNIYFPATRMNRRDSIETVATKSLLASTVK